MAKHPKENEIDLSHLKTQTHAANMEDVHKALEIHPTTCDAWVS